MGGLGFFVEAAIIFIIQTWFDYLIVYARAFSFPPALFATWICNRIFVFSSHQKVGVEIFKYVVTQVIGALLNLAVFEFLILSYSLFREYAILALAAGSAVGLVSNFLISLLWVFKKKPEKAEA